MNNYFFLSGKHTSLGTIAFAPEGTKLAHELIPELDGKKTMPFDFVLKKVTEVKGQLFYSDNLSDLKEIWADYLANSLAWPLMSEKLKILIDANLTGDEGVDWITCKVNANGDVRTYYILRFNKNLDVLNIQKTIFVQGTDHIIKPYFSLSKVKPYSIFTKPSAYNLWKISLSLYVSETLKRIIQKNKVSGLVFEKISVIE